MKRFCKAVSLAVVFVFILAVPIFATNMGRNVKEGIDDAVSTAEDMVKDAVTDIEGIVTDTPDPENGSPKAEGDGIVDGGKDTSLDNKEDGRPGDTTNEKPSTQDTKDTTDKKDSETTGEMGVIEGMELEKNGINPWAIVIAVIVVIAVLVLVFILIPKRRQ